MKKAMAVFLMVCLSFSILCACADQRKSDTKSSLEISSDVIDGINSNAGMSVANSENTLRFYNVGHDFIEMIAEGKSMKEILGGSRGFLQELYAVVENDTILKIYYFHDQKLYEGTAQDSYSFSWCQDVFRSREQESLKTDQNTYPIHDVYCLWGFPSHAPLVIAYDTPAGFVYAVYNAAEPDRLYAYYNQEEFVEYARNLVEQWRKNNDNEDGGPLYCG